MRLLLVKLARVPLVLAAMVVGFSEIARGPAGLGPDVYLAGARAQQSAPVDLDVEAASIDAEARDVSGTAADEVVASSSRWTESLRELRKIPSRAHAWSARLRGLTAADEQLVSLDLAGGPTVERDGVVRVPHGTASARRTPMIHGAAVAP